jgi:hypothetical protein
MKRMDKDLVRFSNRIVILVITLSLVLPITFLPENTKAPGPSELNATLQEIISKVTESDLTNYITDLQNFNTRFAYTTQCNLSAQYIYDEFASYPALSVESDYFVYNSYLVRNIIATLPGVNDSDDTVFVVGGHYDSYSGDAWNNAPGADDDASGTSVALEAAKILSQYRFNSTIKFAAWTTEELGLIGSEHWVQNAFLNDMNIGAYLNFDMIGYDPGNNMGLDIGYNDDSTWISDEMISINSDFSIGLTLTTGPGGTRSDHASFWQWGYPAVECIESDFNTPNYHTINDTIDKLNMVFDRKVTQLGLATLAKLAGVLPPSLGAVYLDRVAYQPIDTVSIKVYDTDLNLDWGSADLAFIEMSSTTETSPEVVTLIETGANTSIFTGSIDLIGGAPGSDGLLQVLEGDTIYADYQDASPLGTRSATAKVDGTPPVISNVAAIPQVASAEITWTTDEPSDSRVYFGISPALGVEAYDKDMVTAHSITIYGLEPSLKYYFDVESTDYAGNSVRDDNLGKHYNFTTLLGLVSYAESGYVGYVKESDPTGNYFTGPDIIVGHGAQGIYHGALQFNNLLFPSFAPITNATIKFFGKQWIYTGSGGSWNLKMLDDDIDFDWQNHGYTDIHNAVVEDTILPTMGDSDLNPRTWNSFFYDITQYTALENHLVNNTISFRLDGPQPGRYIYVWETGSGPQSWGLKYAPSLVVSYISTGDTQGPVTSDLSFSPNPTAGSSQVDLSGLISDTGSGGSNVLLAKYYDPVLNSWISLGAVDGLYNSPSENIEGTIDISLWPDGDYTIWVRGLDESGNWGDLVSIILTKKPTYDIPLSFGWNLISIPLEQGDYAISSVFSSINGYYDAVQYYDSSDLVDPWKHNHILKSPSLNDFNDINYSMGIWIHITEPSGVILEISGSLFIKSMPIEINVGWNLVGYPAIFNESRMYGLNNLIFGTDVDSVWTYDSKLGKWNELQDSDEFVTGKGYWIHSLVKTTWLVPN